MSHTILNLLSGGWGEISRKSSGEEIPAFLRRYLSYTAHVVQKPGAFSLVHSISDSVRSHYPLIQYEIISVLRGQDDTVGKKIWLWS